MKRCERTDIVHTDVLRPTGHLSDSHQDSASSAHAVPDNTRRENARPENAENAGQDKAAPNHAAKSQAGPGVSELLRRAADQDLTAWEELVQRFGQLVFHTAGTIGLGYSDAADASQLTWLRLVEHIHEIREPEHLPAWLAVTARREALRIARTARRYVLSAEPDMDYGKGPRRAVLDVYPVEGDYGPILEAALARLPARYETLIRLLMCDSCPSYTEVAKRMGMPIGSIGPMRMRALLLLRRTLEFSDAEAGPGRYVMC
jgi:DNA-directed RNA polymerase specialized sigma24 family protein